MSGHTALEYVSTLRSYLRVLWHRKWVILVATLVVPALAYALTSREPRQYQASAQVLLAQQDVGSALSGTQSPLTPTSPQTEVALARVPELARLAVKSLQSSMSADAFLAATSVAISSDGGILTLTATTGDPSSAARIATAYARSYVQYRFTSATSGLEAARRVLEARLAHTKPGPVHNSLVVKLQALEELEALRTADATVIQTAEHAAQIGPKIKRNTALGLVLGLVLGVSLAFLFDALDTRVLSAEAIGERLDLPLLARLAAPGRKLRNHHRLAMLAEPGGSHAEAFRILRTNLEFGSLGTDVRTVMVTSAVEKEGKSTTVANLAVAFARAGRRVILVDLDLRRPFIHRFFDLDNQPGLTDVARGDATLDQALAAVSLEPSGTPATTSANGGSPSRERPQPQGRRGPAWLQVLTLGPMPANPGEFIGGESLDEILEAVRERAEIVLIDGPPLFHLGDGLVLSGLVDAVVVVTRLQLVRRAGLNELRRLLDTMPPKKLGFVVTNAEADEGYGYGYGYGYGSYEKPADAHAQQERIHR